MAVRWTRGLALVLSLTAAVACAGNPEPDVAVGLAPGTFEAWDADQDEVLNDDEFAVNWDDPFRAWDRDDDGDVDSAEFAIGVGTEVDEFGGYAAWDADRDGLLDEDEFVDGAFALFDQDDDGVISESEWDAGVDVWQ